MQGAIALAKLTEKRRASVKKYSDRMFQLNLAWQDVRCVTSEFVAEKAGFYGGEGKEKAELSHVLKAPALVGTSAGFGGTRIVPASAVKLLMEKYIRSSQLPC